MNVPCTGACLCKPKPALHAGVLPFLLEMNSQLSCRFGMPEVLSSAQAFSNREKHQQEHPCNSFPGMCILLAWLGNGSRHSARGLAGEWEVLSAQSWGAQSSVLGGHVMGAESELPLPHCTHRERLQGVSQLMGREKRPLGSYLVWIGAACLGLR